MIIGCTSVAPGVLFGVDEHYCSFDFFSAASKPIELSRALNRLYTVCRSFPRACSCKASLALLSRSAMASAAKLTMLEYSTIRIFTGREAAAFKLEEPI